MRRELLCSNTYLIATDIYGTKYCFNVPINHLFNYPFLFTWNISSIRHPSYLIVLVFVIFAPFLRHFSLTVMLIPKKVWHGKSLLLFSSFPLRSIIFEQLWRYKHNISNFSTRICFIMEKQSSLKKCFTKVDDSNSKYEFRSRTIFLSEPEIGWYCENTPPWYRPTT